MSLKNEKFQNKAHKKKNNKKTNNQKITSRRIEFIGLFFCLIAILGILGIFGINAGFVGAKLAHFLGYLFGVGALLSAVIFLLIGLFLITERKCLTVNSRFVGGIFLFLLFLTFYQYLKTPIDESLGGGIIGSGILFIFKKCFGEVGSGVFICIGIIASIMTMTNRSFGALIKSLKNSRENDKDYAKNKTGGIISTILAFKSRLFNKKEIKKEEEPFVEAKLFDQDFQKSEYEKDYTAYDDPAQKYILSFLDGTEKPIEKPIEKPMKQEPATNENNIEKTKEDVQETLHNIVSYWDKTEVSEETEPNAEPNNEEYEKILDDNDESEDEIKKLNEVNEVFDFQGVNKSDDIDLSTPDFREEKHPRGANGFFEDTFENNIEKYEAKFQEEVNKINETKEKTRSLPQKPYELPDITHILSKKEKKQNLALKIEMEDNAKILAKTLEDFKVKANIINSCHGPAVTRYELEPAPGVKVSKITGLSDDLALALAASSVRIEPIPGKSAIGIEVPNKELEGVQLREVLEQPYFTEAESKLTVGLGIDIGGQAIFADLAKMPHLLIAGATGSGKSVCVNTLITSILFKAKPDEVKFILIDPKMVELSNYNGIPHLMVPVVTDPKKAASVLNWAVQEMEKRYTKFAAKVVRNMETYNKKFPEDKMSAIVIIIDELADLMMVSPHEVEDAICRLAQKARAAGIHLVLATQRPSVDVITGIIKANIPSRIAFAVSSQIDSRTILDSSGAEKLLGRGDMLFSPIGQSKPLRVQGAFVSDEEVEILLDFIRGQGQKMEANEEIINFTEQAALEEEKKNKKEDSPKVDELLVDAVDLVVSTDQASASNIQRRFRVGYARAGRMIDTMEMLGILGPSLGSKPREILMSYDEAMETAEKFVEESG